VGWLRAGDVESPRGHGAVVLGFLRAAAGWASRLPRLWRAGGACRPDQGVPYAQLERLWRRDDVAVGGGAVAARLTVSIGALG